jgi:hypothetical protein
VPNGSNWPIQGGIYDQIHHSQDIAEAKGLSRFSLNLSNLTRILIKLDFEMFFHPPNGRVFNSIIRLKNTDLCDFFTNPIFRMPMLDFGTCDKAIPKLCHKCPYVAGESPQANVTITHIFCPLNMNMTRNPVMDKGAWLPDGDYKAVFTLKSDDVEQVTVKYFYKVKIGDSSQF